MKKVFFLILTTLILELSVQELLAQKTVEQLKEELGKTNSLSQEQADLLNKLSAATRKTNKQKSTQYANKALTVATELNYPLGMADAYTNLGSIQGLLEQNAVKAYEYHEKAYRILVKLYEKKEIDKWKMYEFISDNAIPVYKFVTEKEGKKTRKDKKAIQNYQKLNAEMSEYITQIAADTREQLLKSNESLSEASSALSETASKLSETNSKLSETKTKLSDKSTKERLLIIDKIKLSGNLKEKEKEAIQLTDSLWNQQLILQQRELKLQMQALKLSEEKTKADKLAQEKALHEEQALNQRIFTIAAGVISLLAVAFLVVVYFNFRGQKKLNKMLVRKNEQINHQKEEIEQQKDNLQQMNEELNVQKEEIAAQRDNLQELNEKLDLERSQADRLLRNILPDEVALELKETGKAKPKYYEMVTVIFTDFKGFTHLAEKMHPEQIIQDLNDCFFRFDEIVEKFGIEKIKTIGDAYMCAGGIPIPNTTNALDSVRAAIEMQQVMKDLNERKLERGEPIWELRLGIHTGPLVAGVIGKNKFAYDVWGDTVNIAARMESSGEVGKVNISGTTYEHIKAYFDCEHRGKISAKNKGEVDMYFVVKAKGEAHTTRF